MSPSIWTECAGDSEVRPFSCTGWRAVEAQHVVSTSRLVDTLEEQALLEELLEQVKPPSRHGPEFSNLHYLLAAPFRYPPLRHGSRFASRHEPSLLYASCQKRTCFAEVAYYRLLFLAGTAAPFDRVAVDLSILRVAVRTRRGIDLSVAPFDRFLATIASPVSYTATQQLGSAMRTSGVHAFRYPSARDLERGTNLAVFTPRALARKTLSQFETWHCLASHEAVEFLRRDPLGRERFRFDRTQFVVDGELPAPAP